MPQAYRVIVMPEAIEDLRKITEYIRRDSPQNAIKVFERLWRFAQSLSIFPNGHRIRRQRRDPSKTVRAMPVPPFMVYHRVDDGHHGVRVLTIRHGRRKQPRQFR